MKTFLLFKNIIFETFEFVKILLGADTVYLTRSYFINYLYLSFYVFGAIFISYMHLFSLLIEELKVPPT